MRADESPPRGAHRGSGRDQGMPVTCYYSLDGHSLSSESLQLVQVRARAQRAEVEARRAQAAGDREGYFMARVALLRIQAELWSLGVRAGDLHEHRNTA